MQKLMQEIESKFLLKDREGFSIGDTLRIRQRIVEGEKERLQTFEGVVIARKGKGINTTINVCKVTNNIYVERVFILHSPRLENIKVTRRGKVRRSKLFYLRERKGKSARVKERLT